MKPWRVRRSTIVLIAVFVVTLGVYIVVRPAPVTPLRSNPPLSGQESPPATAKFRPATSTTRARTTAPASIPLAPAEPATLLPATIPPATIPPATIPPDSGASSSTTIVPPTTTSVPATSTSL